MTASRCELARRFRRLACEHNHPKKCSQKFPLWFDRSTQQRIPQKAKRVCQKFQISASCWCIFPRLLRLIKLPSPNQTMHENYPEKIWLALFAATRLSLMSLNVINFDAHMPVVCVYGFKRLRTLLGLNWWGWRRKIVDPHKKAFEFLWKTFDWYCEGWPTVSQLGGIECCGNMKNSCVGTKYLNNFSLKRLRVTLECLHISFINQHVEFPS